MKHMKKLIAMLLVIAMVASMIPAVFAADSSLTDLLDETKSADKAAIDTAELDALWVEIETMYDLSATKDGTVEDPAVVAQKAAAMVEASNIYVDGSLQWNGDGTFTWETTLGIPGLYSTKLQEQRAGDRSSPLDDELAQNKAAADVYNSYDHIYSVSDLADYGLKKLQTNVYGQSYGNSGEIVVVFAPYYGSDSSFTDAYVKNGIKMAKQLQGTLLVYASTAATVSMIAAGMDEARVVMIDTHGTTDYYKSWDDSGYPMYETGIEDCTSRANASYVCIKSNSGFTSADTAAVSGPYGTYYHAASAGSGTYAVDGTAIANHMDPSEKTNCFAWIGSCLGMSTNSLCKPLQAAGVEALYGYSQSVTFFGDVVFLDSFTTNLVSGKSVAASIQAMKNLYGNWDPYYRYWYTYTYSDYYGSGYYYDYYYTNYYPGYTFYNSTLSMVQKDRAAFPVVVSAKDAYPGQGRVDNYQTVKCEWYLNSHPTFYDVPTGSFYYTPVDWANNNGITSGTTDYTFGPLDSCTRGHVVTFLWRAAGSPEPTSTNNPFTDVAKGKFYYKAVLWAVENGITAGMTKTTFAPDAPCTRGQVVTFLWRSQGKPAPTSNTHPFTDVRSGAFYYNAMLWAVQNGVTAGMTKTTFAPEATCTRGQVVTFLYRTYN